MRIKLDDGFHDHPKVRAIIRDNGYAPIGFLVCLMTWSGRHLTDGRVPEQVVCDFLGHKSRETTLVTPLISAGFCKWSRKRHGVTGRTLVIHDFTDYNEAADEVKARRAADAERQRAWRAAQRNGGSHGVTGPKKGGLSQHPDHAFELPPKPPAASRSQTNRKPKDPVPGRLPRSETSDEAESRARALGLISGGMP